MARFLLLTVCLISCLSISYTQVIINTGHTCGDAIPISITSDCTTPTSNMLDFVDAVNLGGTECDPTSTNLGLWYSVQAPPSGTITISSPLNSSIEMALYDSCGGVSVFCQTTFGFFDYNITGLMPGATYYLAVYSNFGTPTNPYQFCLLEGPACPGPSFSEPVFVSYDFAEVFYPNDTNATGVTAEFGPEGFTLGTGTQYRDSTESPGVLPLLGLQPGAFTEYYIWEDCAGGDPDTSGPFFVETFCLPITPDYTNSFDVVPGPCFLGAAYGDQTFGPGFYGNSFSTLWTDRDWLNMSGTTNGNSASVNIFFEDDVIWLISSPFDLSGGGSYELSFEIGLTEAFVAGPGVMGTDDVIQLLVSTDGSSWSPIITWNDAAPPTDTGEVITVDLSPYVSPTTSFAFYVNSGPMMEPDINYDVFVDNFQITATGTPDPCALVSLSNSIPSGIYTGSGILSDGIVSASSNVLFAASDSVVLQPEFQVDLGAVFEARIEDCVLGTF